MFTRLTKWKFSLVRLFSSLPAFLLAYGSTRPLQNVVRTLPAVLFSAVLLLIFVNATSESRRAALFRRYAELTRRALNSSHPVTAEIYLARMTALSDNPQETLFHFAENLYLQRRSADGTSAAAMNPITGRTDDPLTNRALALMQSLAPRRTSGGGYAPAHRFLAQHWRAGLLQTDSVRLTALHHDVLAEPQNVAPALALAKFLADRGYHQRAIDVLMPFQQSHAEAQLQLAAAFAELGDHANTKRFLKTAIQNLETTLQATPHDVDVRVMLSRATAADGRLTESIFLLAEGLVDTNPEPELVDQLIRRYVVWLSLLPERKRQRTLEDIDLAVRLLPASNITAQHEQTGSLTLSTGTVVELPMAVVNFHQALMNGQGRCLIPLLLGTEKAGRGRYSSALSLLERAIAAAPGHPMIANNLAWTLLQTEQAEATEVNTPANPPVTAQHSSVVENQPSRNLRPSDTASPDDVGASTPAAEAKRSAEVLERAWQLACSAVESCPENAAFRETRAQVAFRTDRPAVAAADLQKCVELGEATSTVQQLLMVMKHEAAENRNTD